MSNNIVIYCDMYSEANYWQWVLKEERKIRKIIRKSIEALAKIESINRLIRLLSKRHN